MNRKIREGFVLLLLLISLLVMNKSSYNITEIKEPFFIFLSFFSFVFLFYFEKKKSIKIALLDLVILALPLFSIVMLPFLRYHSFAFHYVQISLSATMMYFSLRMIKPERLLSAFEVIGVLSAVYGILLYYEVDLLRLYPVPTGIRPPSFYGNSNFFAALLIPFILISLTKYFLAEGIRMRALHLLFIGVESYAIFLTRTRAAFVGLIPVLIAFLIIILIWKKRLWTRFIPLAMLAIAILFIVPSDYWGRIRSMTDIGKGTPMFRVYTWNSSLQIIKDNPMGVGPGNFRAYYPEYKSKQIFLFEGKHNAETIHAHSDPIESAVDLGIFGFALYLFMFIGFFFFFFRAAFTAMKSGREKTAISLLGVNLGLMGLMLDNLFSVNSKWLSSIIVIYLLLALGSAYAARIYKRKWSFRVRPLFLIVLALLGGFLLFLSMRRYHSSLILNKAIARSKDGLALRSHKHVNRAKGSFIKAQELYKEALRYDPNNIIARYFTGTLLQDLYISTQDEEHLREAIKAYEHLQKLSEHYVQVHFLKGRTYYYLREYKKALYEFELYLHQDPVDLEVYKMMIDIYNRTGQVEKKKKLLSELGTEIELDLKIKPDRAELFRILEFAYMETNEPYAIIKTYEGLIPDIQNIKAKELAITRLSAFYATYDIERGIEYFSRTDIPDIDNEMIVRKLKEINEAGK
ncbi:O-antigen ligase family protein [bacterium]|nr:O-antigen ligase family protein [bacterium]